MYCYKFPLIFIMFAIKLRSHLKFTVYISCFGEEVNNIPDENDSAQWTVHTREKFAFIKLSFDHVFC